MTGEWHLVPVLPGDVGIWLLLASSDGANALHIECASPVGTLFLVWGNLLGSAQEISERTFANNSDEAVKTGLKGTLDGGTERPVLESSKEGSLTTESLTDWIFNYLEVIKPGGSPIQISEKAPEKILTEYRVSGKSGVLAATVTNSPEFEVVEETCNKEIEKKTTCLVVVKCKGIDSIGNIAVTSKALTVWSVERKLECVA
jgi:hypothetical protein